jgi:hypothetical protein
MVSIDRLIIICNISFKSFLKEKQVKEPEEEAEVPKRKQEGEIVKDTAQMGIELRALKSFRQKHFQNKPNRLQAAVISMKKNGVEKCMLIVVTLLVLINIHFLIFLNQDQSVVDFSSNSSLVGQNNDSSSQLMLAYESCLPLMNESITIYSREIVNRRMFMCFLEHNTDFYKYFLTYVYVWVDLSIFSFVPFAVMAFCSLFIWIKLTRKRKGY